MSLPAEAWATKVLLISVFTVIAFTVAIATNWRYARELSLRFSTTGTERELVVLLNTEGVAKQLAYLNCYVELAQATNRTLVIAPLISDHYDGAPIYLDDLADFSRLPVPTSRYSVGHEIWLTEHGDDECVSGHVASDLPRPVDTFATVEEQEEDILKNTVRFNFYYNTLKEHPFHIEPRDAAIKAQLERAHDGKDNLLQITDEVKGRDSWKRVCAVTIGFSECTDKYVYHPAKSAENLWNVGMHVLYGTRNVQYDALHLRRGDKCESGSNVMYSGDEFRCQDLRDNQVVLSMCEKAARDQAPLYISTDETDENQLVNLWTAGCLTLANATSEVAQFECPLCRVANGVKGIILDMMMLAHATTFYTAGGSNVDKVVHGLRVSTGGDGAWLWDENDARFVPVRDVDELSVHLRRQINS